MNISSYFAWASLILGSSPILLYMANWQKVNALLLGLYVRHEIDRTEINPFIFLAPRSGEKYGLSDWSYGPISKVVPDFLRERLTRLGCHLAPEESLFSPDGSTWSLADFARANGFDLMFWGCWRNTRIDLCVLKKHPLTEEWEGLVCGQVRIESECLLVDRKGDVGTTWLALSAILREVLRSIKEKEAERLAHPILATA